MRLVINEFESRVKEIDIYFTFLENILESDVELHFPKKKRQKYKKIDGELTKILRANGFLLLYNLVESSVKKSIEEIFNSLNSEGATYKDVSEEMKKKWIEIKYKNFKNQEYVAQKIFECISNIELDIINMPFDAKHSISGNVDSRKIKDFSSSYGFSSKTHHSTKDGEKLLTVKSKRNDLAHGVISFCDCGKDYTIEDLITIKKQVISYLRGILKNVGKFIDEKQYLAVQPLVV